MPFSQTNVFDHRRSGEGACRIPGRAPVLFTLLLLVGCSSMDGASGDVKNILQTQSTGINPIRIESEPSGAEVYVMGERIGVTPIKISPREVFPNTYRKEQESLYGKVILKKAGCSDFTRTVNTKIANVGLLAQLECGDWNPPRKSREASDAGESVEQRLGKIKDLLNKELITEEEAKKARARVLNEL
jgi:hypothetical protein